MTGADTVQFANAQTFDQWKAAVDAGFQRVTTFSSDDFVDWSYASAFEDGVEPAQAAHQALAQDAQGRAFLALAGINPDELF